MDGRLLISFIAVCFSATAIVYDYIHPFPKSKIVGRFEFLVNTELNVNFCITGARRLFNYLLHSNGRSTALSVVH